MSQLEREENGSGAWDWSPNRKGVSRSQARALHRVVVRGGHLTKGTERKVRVQGPVLAALAGGLFKPWPLFQETLVQL